MTSPVLAAFIPVVLFIAIGFFAGRRGWMTPAGARELSNLVFLVLTPALLFRTMSRVRVGELDFAPVAAYLIGALALFALAFALRGFNRRAAVMALAATYSNAVMIGIPVIGYAYGDAGLVTLFTLHTVHALVLLTSATVLLELAVAREAPSDAEAPSATSSTPSKLRASSTRTVLRALGQSIVHPVPLPIIAGLVWAQSGVPIPAVIDLPLAALGQAFAPMALLLVGISLAYSRVGAETRTAVLLAVAKNALLPLAVAGVALALGVTGLPLVVMVVAASLPIGANVFLFSQRYRVAEDVVTAAVAISTLAALVTVPVVMALAARL